ncbi:MAG: hypothetical protein FWG65_04550 [Turicibacter sp.]|nr:hypothetical protein [Turicibacter sp.]
MSIFSFEMDNSRPYRYAFLAQLWDKRRKKYSTNIGVLLDTGAYNTVIHKALVPQFATMLKTTIPTVMGGYKGDANI